MCNRPKPDPDPHSTVPTPVRPGARDVTGRCHLPPAQSSLDHQRCIHPRT